MVQPLPLVDYPDTDGQPMTESDATRNYLVYCVETLRLFFKSRRNVYVSGNLFIYYEEGNPQASISPDVFVIFGVSKRQRRSYKTWQEGNRLPSFVLEITSLSTRKQDEETKPLLYERLGIAEYFQFDPTGDYLKPALKGRRLVRGSYQVLTPTVLADADGTMLLYSESLGLELRSSVPGSPGREWGLSSLARELRFYDLLSGTKLLSLEETEQALTAAEQERDAAEQERRLAVPRLGALGLTVEQIAEALNLSLDEVTGLLNSLE